MNINLDNASATFILDEVIDAVNQSTKDFYASSLNFNKLSDKTIIEIENCRRKIAELVNCNSEDIIFTSGGTEANNLAIIGAIRKNKIKTVITSQIEHASVINPLKYLELRKEIKLLFLNLDKFANIQLSELEQLLTDNQNSLVSLSHSNYLTGNLLQIKKVSRICKQYNSIFHSDIIQSMAYLKNDFESMGMDIATVSAHKFHGPKAVGFVYLKSGINIENILFGEDNEYGIRPGTENISGIVGMTKALEIMQLNIKANYSKCSEIKNIFIEKLNQLKIKFEVFGNTESACLPNIINIKFSDESNSDLLLKKLAVNNIFAKSGNIPKLNINNAIRFSFSFLNTKDEIQNFKF